MHTTKRSISIDFDIHKMIETNRKSFAESENDVLRRLLDLPPGSPVATTAQKGLSLEQFLNGASSGKTTPNSHDSQRTLHSWFGKGVELPAGTELRLDCQGLDVSGVIQNGKWVFGDEQFLSPSRAACEIVSRVRGRPISLNGWVHWKVRCPGSAEWVALNSLRNPATIEQRRR